MIKEINPSVEYLKAITGKFDLETVFNLTLENKSISKLNAIPQCTSLVLLNLSKNKLTSISGLNKMIQLVFLDLSFNNISNIDGLEVLINLKHLKLHGNNINGPLPNKFKKLKRIEKITFQIMSFEDDKDINTSNPICQTANYRQNILDMFPSLKMLDGIPRDMDAFLLEDEKEDNSLNDKLDPKNFNFDFGDKIKFEPNEVISDEDIQEIKKNIEEKYLEFERGIEELKASLKEIK